MHEVVQYDLSNTSWENSGNTTLTVGIWSPYYYRDLEKTGRVFFIIVSDRASFSERIFQENSENSDQADPESVKISLIQHLQNNFTHSYVFKEKMERSDQREYFGDFRTMKPFLQTFRELNPEELSVFANDFTKLTEKIYKSSQADYLVKALDGNSELHFELASKLSFLHEEAANAEQKIKEIVHGFKQITLHRMAEELLLKLSEEDAEEYSSLSANSVEEENTVITKRYDTDEASKNTGEEDYSELMKPDTEDYSS